MHERYSTSAKHNPAQRLAHWLMRNNKNISSNPTDRGLPYSTALSHVRIIETETETVPLQEAGVPALIADLNKMYDTCIAEWEAEDLEATKPQS